jgi:hypothetical protein
MWSRRARASRQRAGPQGAETGPQLAYNSERQKCTVLQRPQDRCLRGSSDIEIVLVSILVLVVLVLLLLRSRLFLLHSGAVALVPIRANPFASSRTEFLVRGPPAPSFDLPSWLSTVIISFKSTYSCSYLKPPVREGSSLALYFFLPSPRSFKPSEPLET